MEYIYGKKDKVTISMVLLSLNFYINQSIVKGTLSPPLQKTPFLSFFEGKPISKNHFVRYRQVDSATGTAKIVRYSQVSAIAMSAI